MNFELGFGVCLYKTQNHTWFTGKATNGAFKVINGILNYQIFLTLTLTLTLYTKNTVA